MKISYDGGVAPKEAGDVLTRLGIEVESLTVIDLSQIIVGKVVEQKPHRKSKTKLWIHQVDLGTRTEQIIAGADNAVPGSLVPVALPGTTVPNGKVVKDLNIAGYSAKGMLCSAEELLLGDDHSGILILDSGKPGDPLTSVIPSQATMDVEITSNRPDCMGHLGVARELAAGLDKAMKVDFMPAFTGKAEPAGRDMVKVSIATSSTSPTTSSSSTRSHCTRLIGPSFPEGRCTCGVHVRAKSCCASTAWNVS